MMRLNGREAAARQARRHMRGEMDRLFCTALMYMWYVVHVLMYICTVYRRVIGWTTGEDGVGVQVM